MECTSDWYFTKDELTKGYNSDELKAETAIRRSTCAFLQEAGMKLGLPQLTIATAIVFFHRFYATRKLLEYDRHIIATTCLFLAGKVEETPKKLKDIIGVTETLRQKDTFPHRKLDFESPEFLALREKILTHELLVLQTIAFDMTIEHPYKYLLMYVKQIQGNRNLAQVAWNFVNDSLRTTLCLQFKPQLIASAAIYLASKFLKYQLPEAWWDVFHADIKDLEEISNQILDLYESPGSVINGSNGGAAQVQPPSIPKDPQTSTPPPDGLEPVRDIDPSKLNGPPLGSTEDNQQPAQPPPNGNV